MIIIVTLTVTNRAAARSTTTKIYIKTLGRRETSPLFVCSMPADQNMTNKYNKNTERRGRTDRSTAHVRC
jgi:hypothetical protein